jgi:outer membrane protein
MKDSPLEDSLCKEHPMIRFQSLIALLCVWLVAAPWTYAQEGQRREDTTPRLDTESPHWYSRFTNAYNPRIVPPVNVSNSGRLDSLLRGGQLYLSLADAVALALENNLDIEVQRYEFPLAQADLLRAQSGSSIIGIPTGVTTGVTTGAISTNILGLLNTGVASAPASTSFAPGISLDPAFTGAVSWGHTTTPLSNSVVSGLTTSITTTKVANFGITQGFLTGGSAALTYSNSDALSNSFTNIYNPATTSSLDLSIAQPLLQGFGLAINNRTIRIARNNLRAADLVFKQQVINTVANVIQLYWNLVYFSNDADVKRRAVTVSEKLYNDNQKQVEVGTLAPISVVQAQAQMATDQQALVQSETNVLQQETIIKSALSRNGLASPSVTEARVVPTDPVRIPEVEAIEPIQDLVARALDNRPELAQSRIQIDNAKISLTGTRNQMLPSISAVADLRNNALSGNPNTVVNTTALGNTPPPGFSIATNKNPGATHGDPFFIGGYGNVLSQLFARNFPNYTVGVNLTIPLRNRSAQANMNTAELTLRQNELAVQRLINQIRVDVQTALTAVTQARAQFQAAAQAVALQRQTTDAEEKKLAAGASTPYNVILTQRDLATAEDNLVLAQATYAFARNQLDWATGTILERNNVQFEEAKQGTVSRPPSALPVLNR